MASVSKVPVWLEVRGGAIYLDGSGTCADVVPRDAAELVELLGARYVASVDPGSPNGLGDAPLVGTRPLFVAKDRRGAQTMLRAPEVLGLVEPASALATGEHALPDLDDDVTAPFAYDAVPEDDRPTVKNLDAVR